MSILFTSWNRRILNLIAVLMGLCALVLLGSAIFKWQFVLDLPVIGTHPFLWALVFALGTLSIKFILRVNQMRGRDDDSRKDSSTGQSPPKCQEASSELAASEEAKVLLATSEEVETLLVAEAVSVATSKEAEEVPFKELLLDSANVQKTSSELAASKEAKLTGLARRLVEYGLLSPETAEAAFNQALKERKSFVTYLVEKKLVSNCRDLAMVTAEEFGVPVVDIESIDLNPDTIKRIDERLIGKHKVLPIFERGNRLFIAISDPTNRAALDDIRFHTKMNPEPVVVEEDKLAKVIERALEVFDTSMKDLGCCCDAEAVAPVVGHPNPLKPAPASQPLLHKSQPLPHNGLFIRRNNSFGTQLTTSMKELIAQGVMIKQEQIRFDDFVAINTEGVPSPKPNNALAVSHGIAAIPAHQQHDDRATHYLEIALKTANTASGGHFETQAPPVNYIFVVDISGSMAGEKIDTVKASIRELFTHLQETDVIGVIAFDDKAQTILESTPKQQLSADQFGKIINSLTVRGGTDLNLALSISIDEMKRYQGTQRVNQLFLFSDGNPNCGESNWINIRQNVAAKLRQSATSGGNIRLSTFVFGTDANRVEMDKLSGMTGGQSIFVIEPEKDVIHSLQQELARRSHLAAINVQMQIEIDPNIEILHFYGHDLITDPTTRAAVEREASLTRDKVKKDYGVESLPDLITEDKGIRVFVPNLAVGETYWVVLELAVPEPQQSTVFGKATVQYFDTVARQNQKPQFDLSPTGPIEPQWVVQHALGLWTSEVAAYALNDVEAHDLKTAEKRIQAHLSVLDTAKSDLTFQHAAKLTDDIITLNKLLSLAKNLNQAPQAGQAMMYLNYGLGELDKVRNGFVQNVEYGG